MYTVEKFVKFSTEFLSKLRHFLFFFKFTSLNFVCIRKIFHFMICFISLLDIEKKIYIPNL